MTAIIFPGQGSQYLNMAMDFNENFDVAKRVFQEIEDNTEINIRKIITENPLDNLNQTNYTQISIFSASMAIYKSFLSEFGYEIIKPKTLSPKNSNFSLLMLLSKLLWVNAFSKVEDFLKLYFIIFSSSLIFFSIIIL